MAPRHGAPVGRGLRPDTAFFWVRCKPGPLLLPRGGPGAAGQNKQHSITKNTAKLDRETEELHHDRVTLEVGKVIQQGRQSKGLTQKDLATVSAAGVLPGWPGRRGSGLRTRCVGLVCPRSWDSRGLEQDRCKSTGWLPMCVAAATCCPRRWCLRLPPWPRARVLASSH